MGYNNFMEESWKNVIGILYQSILGTHEEKVTIISKWLTDIIDTPFKPVNLDIVVEIYSEPYK